VDVAAEISCGAAARVKPKGEALRALGIGRWIGEPRSGDRVC
jgi:hypothetical protein